MILGILILVASFYTILILPNCKKWKCIESCLTVTEAKMSDTFLFLAMNNIKTHWAIIIFVYVSYFLLLIVVKISIHFSIVTMTLIMKGISFYKTLYRNMKYLSNVRIFTFNVFIRSVNQESNVIDDIIPLWLHIHYIQLSYSLQYPLNG